MLSFTLGRKIMDGPVPKSSRSIIFRQQHMKTPCRDEHNHVDPQAIAPFTRRRPRLEIHAGATTLRSARFTDLR